MSALIVRSTSEIAPSGSSQQLELFARQTFEVIAAGYTSPATREAYWRDTQEWISFCKLGDINPYTATPLEVAAFRETQLQTAATSSVHRKMAALSAIYRRLQSGGNPTLVNPFDQKTTKRPSSSALTPRPAVGEDAAAQLFAACDADADVFFARRDKAILALLWATGIRRGSAAGALRSTWEEQAAGEAALRVPVKGGAQKTIRVPAEAAQVIRDWLSVHPASAVFLFTGKNGARMGDSTVSAVVKRRAREAGLDEKLVMAHGFRAGFITRAYEAEVPEVDIQKAAGHAFLETTRSYDRGIRGANVSRTVGDLPVRKP